MTAHFDADSTGQLPFILITYLTNQGYSSTLFYPAKSLAVVPMSLGSPAGIRWKMPTNSMHLC